MEAYNIKRNRNQLIKTQSKTSPGKVEVTDMEEIGHAHNQME